MNFIDYVTLMLVNMAAGLLILAFFLWRDLALTAENNRRWTPSFAISGTVAVICGFAMTFTWPLPSPYNIAFGETSVMLGFLFLAAAWALAKGWDLLPLAIYAFVAGLTGILVGVRIWHLGLTANPPLSAIGFILTACGGVFAGLVLWLRQSTLLRRTGSVILSIAALLWLYTAFLGYWEHLQTPPP